MVAGGVGHFALQSADLGFHPGLLRLHHELIIRERLAVRSCGIAVPSAPSNMVLPGKSVASEDTAVEESGFVN